MNILQYKAEEVKLYRDIDGKLLYFNIMCSRFAIEDVPVIFPLQNAELIYDNDNPGWILGFVWKEIQHMFAYPVQYFSI